MTPKCRLFPEINKRTIMLQGHNYKIMLICNAKDRPLDSTKKNIQKSIS